MPGDPVTVLEAFRRTAARHPDRPTLIYFDTVLRARDVDRASDALAAALADNGFVAGDRIALYLQNMPQYVLGLLAAWKLGGIAVPINPMLTPAEVAKLLDDATPTVLLALDELHTPALAEVLTASSVREVITTSALDWLAAAGHPGLPRSRLPTPPGAEELRRLIAGHDGRVPPPASPALDDFAVITYTSGTTGAPKGAMNTHRNIATGGRCYREWFDLSADEVVLGVAPLFHVTGLSGHIACALVCGAPLVLSYRFDTAAVIDMIRRHRATFTVGAITVFIALANAAASTPGDLATLRKIASGGSPVAAATVERFERRFGVYIHNVYGMTETTSPVLAVPLGKRAPTGAETEALSVGRPMPGTRIAVLDDTGAPLPAGQIGEIAVAGPQVVPGYWRSPEETAAAFRGGWLRTGDVGYADDDGWYYLVDRKKDMIVASGYKVWPREVEDVLYTHEAVLEAAVIGVPHPYRGETVKAYVSLRQGHSVSPDELIGHCRAQLAAYKYPREVEIVDAIPKTATGKILRRNFRDDLSRAPRRRGHA
ncbi:AMP-binding protein [Mycobacterium branderi]|uniref:Long-chain-fatty-acid--CoA ligase FadD13 n=1 Tax=Mycobacterium branderi TaxID=43348 RepID=A0A7I7WBC6_9MYCO|nr:AMP-binding protein [Mycobacterium branderi]MCV7231580.1 AMP-binding protein [Mycobacterium branderi]ORA40423.1 acyl-CoA synthetase [Mycobacterium branderi]BBZ14936.1 long-chain-fatty-acid--CoA ligase [Mycobacterium branderi]